MNNKKGFTLSEAFITMVIIGIVAVIVVPALIDSSSAKVNQATARKAQYEIAQIGLRLQAACPRYRYCTSGTVKSNLQSLIPDDKAFKMRFHETTENSQYEIYVDNDDNNKYDMHYTLYADGRIVDDATCNYEVTTGCPTSDVSATKEDSSVTPSS